MKYILVPTLAAFFISAPSGAEIRGELNTRAMFNQDGISQFEHNFTPSYTLSGSNFRLYSEFRVRIETVDAMEPGQFSEPSSSEFSKRMTANDYVEFEVREFFADGYVGDFFLKLGKQQIVWGQSDGLRILDVVNPLNYREFILTELDERRIPLWTASIERRIGDWQLQAVWVPDQTYDYLPNISSDATFALTSPLFIPPLSQNQHVRLNQPKRRDKVVKDSDAGFRLSSFTENGWDLAFVYFYHFRDQPVLTRSVEQTFIEVNQTYERSHLVGVSASNALGDFILRSELGYSTNVHYLTKWDTATTDFEVSPEIAGVVGLDYQGVSNVFISGQLFINHITDFNESITREETELQYTLRYEQTFENESWTLTLQNIQSINRGDGLIQISLDHQYSSVVVLSTGLDIFYGDDQGLFGQFESEDRVYVGFNYSF